ncbi:MAG: hypothetical protein KBD83_07800 [Gammaproteobacteria bacterium]|nr:hypothetical protein [Gammaproteobacteria bacterium]
MELQIHSGYTLAKAYLEQENNDLTKLLAYFSATERRETDWCEFKAASYPLREHVESVMDQFNLEWKGAYQLGEEDCLWQIARAVISLLNTTGGMIVIGIKEDDFTTIPLIDPEIEELKYPEYREKTLKPKVVGCAKWKSLTLAESSKKKPSQIQFTADEKVRISDYVSFIAGSANKGTVSIILVKPRFENPRYIVGKKKLLPNGAQTSKDDEIIFVRKVGDIGEIESLSLKIALGYDFAKESNYYASIFNELKSFKLPKAEGNINHIRDNIIDAIIQLEILESILDSSIDDLMHKIQQIVANTFDDGRGDNHQFTSLDYISVVKKISGNSALVRSATDIFNLLFNGSGKLTENKAKKVYYNVLDLLEELKSEIDPIIPDKTVKATIRHNLPRKPPLFSGRSEEMRRLLDLLNRSSRHFYLTITGMGGIGKTTLAIEAAYKCMERAADKSEIAYEYKFENIVWVTAQDKEWTMSGKIVPSASNISCLDDILRTILDFIEPNKGHGNLTSEKRRQLVIDLLSKQRTLLILDNLETVTDTSIKHFFSSHIPDPSKVIVTDRGFAEEGVTISLSKISREESADMLKQFICELDAKVVFPEQEIKRLAEASGGIPRIIHWIAHLVARKKYSVARCESILSKDSADLYVSLFDWSFQQLSESSKKLTWLLLLLEYPASMHLLAIISGFTEDEILDYAEDPIRLTIFSKIDNENANGIRLLYIDQVTRKYVSGDMHNCPTDRTSNVDIAIRLVDYLVNRCGKEGWIAENNTSFISENINHIEWAWSLLNKHSRTQEMIDLVFAACPYVGHLGRNDLRIQMSQQTYSLIADDQTRTKEQARLLINHLGWVDFIQGNHDSALKRYHLGLKKATACDDIRLKAMALKGIGQIHKEAGELHIARDYILKAIEVVQHLGPTPEAAVLYGTLSSLVREQGDINAAIQHLDTADSIAREVQGVDELMLVFKQKLAKLLLSAGRLDEAEEKNRETESLNISMKREAGIAYTRQLDALIEEKRGNEIGAWQKIREAYKLFESIGMKREIEGDHKRIHARISDLRN